MKKLRIGIIGCGRISMKHFDAAAASDMAELIACCDVKIDRAEEKSDEYSIKAYTNYKEMLLKDGVDEKVAVENANFVLPRATNLTLTIGFTPEALIHFMHKRLCVRAQDEVRKVAIAMKKEVAEILPEYVKQLTPHCQHLLWCPEGKKMTCGAYPRKEELLKKLKEERQETLAPMNV